MNRTYLLFVCLISVFFYLLWSRCDHKLPLNTVEIGLLQSKEASSKRLLPEPIVIEDKRTTQADRPKTVNRFARYMALQKKVVPSSREAMEREMLLTDSNLVTQAFAKLTGANLDNATERLEAIDYLEDVVTFPNNAIRDEVIRQVEDYLRAPIEKSPNLNQLKSTLGDKMEIFALLAKAEKSKAEAILQNVDDSKLRRLYEYTNQRLNLKLSNKD